MTSCRFVECLWTIWRGCMKSCSFKLLLFADPNITVTKPKPSRSSWSCRLREDSCQAIFHRRRQETTKHGRHYASSFRNNLVQICCTHFLFETWESEGLMAFLVLVVQKNLVAVAWRMFNQDSQIYYADLRTGGIKSKSKWPQTPYWYTDMMGAGSFTSWWCCFQWFGPCCRSHAGTYYNRPKGL